MPGDLTMVLVGDLYVQRDDPDTAFEPILPYTKDADVVFCNLETVIADAKYLAPGDHDHRPRTDERILPHYQKAGFNLVNIANNPVMYHGMACFTRHLDVLDAAGMAYAGGGRNITEARRPGIVEKNGVKVALVARTSVGFVDAGATADKPGVARFKIRTAYEMHDRVHEVPGSPPIIHTMPDEGDRAALAEDIKTARSQADVVVLSWHWGVSSATGGGGGLVGYQKEMAHFAIDAGADLVVGHHPHVLQGIEVYKGKVIAYSLGNYLHDMDSFRSHASMPTALLRVRVANGKIAGVSYVPARLEGVTPPEFLRPADARDVVDFVTRLSQPLGTRFEVGADEVSVVI
jgi:poly-gamma-glutamate synthesis protein (capsule biosynthesis protein)